MKQYRYIFSVLLVLCFLMPAMAQQTKTISGVVLDEKSEPVIGANIIVTGTKLGTVTNLDGKFTLNNIPAGQKNIQVSYIGYQQQNIEITDKKALIINLQTTSSDLNEVVVVGYGSQKKAHMTGSIVTLSAKEVTDINTTNFATALKGQMNGVSVSGGEGRPGSSATVAIRQATVASQFSSVPGYVPETSPLYVIDDYITTEAAFNNLDATMVESVTVLKDASAAVYGARSAQGVILVKTKRGKEGAPKISYSGQFGVADEISRPKMLSAYDYGKIWNGVRAANDPLDVNKPDAKTAYFQADELAAMKNLNYDLLDREWRTAYTQKHNINISGGTDRANYFAGVSYNTQGGNIGKLDYNRWNYRAGVDAKISKSLKASLQVSGDYGNKTNAYSNVGSSTGDNDYNYLLTHPRYMPDYVNGIPLASFGSSNSQYETSQLYNFSTIQNLGNYSKDMSQNMTLNSSIEYDFGWSNILKGLKLKVSYSKNISTTKNDTYGTSYTLYKINQRAGSGEHLFSGVNDFSNSNLSSITVTNGNILSRTMSRSDDYQANFVVTYARSFGKHDVSGLFTIEREEGEGEDLLGSVTNPYSFTNYQSNGADNGVQATTFSRTEKGMLSYVGRLNYAYANKYLLELLLRSDASTKFAPENYWGYFPSLSAGWVLSEEPWIKDKMQGIDFLKLRGSFGLLGKDNIKPWQWMTSYSLNQDKGAIFGTGTSTATGSHIGVPDGAANRNSHWDKSYQSNLGIDLNTLKNRLTLNLDAYYGANRDVFMTRQGSADYPATVGAQASAENFGSIDTYGIELSMGWKENISKDFKYWIKLNTGYSDNKVLVKFWPSLIPFDDYHPNQRSDVGSWGYECIGMFHNYQEIEEYFDKYHIVSYMGRTKDNVRPGMLIYNNIRGSQKTDGTYYGPNDPSDPKSGYVDANDKVLISNRSNPWGFTVNMGGEWKGFSFSTQIGANWGGYTYLPGDARGISSFVSSNSAYTLMEYTNLPSYWANNMFVYDNVLDNLGNVVAEKNLTAKYPNLRYSINSEQSTFWRVSATTVSIKTLTFAYSLPKNWMKSVNIESCRLNATVQNVLSLYNPYPDSFIDPMSGTYGRYPTLRRITIGVNVSF